jgi:DNA-binding CsgD family transcriptional regulator
MSSKTIGQTLAELRNLPLGERRSCRQSDAVALIGQLLAVARLTGAEQRANGLRLSLLGQDEGGTTFNLSCLLHDSAVALRLTTAERAVAEQLCEGRTLAQIARLRGVSANTVKSQVRQIFRKLDVDSRVALVRLLSP